MAGGGDLIGGSAIYRLWARFTARFGREARVRRKERGCGVDLAQGWPERACGGTLRCAAPASVRRREEAATEEEKESGRLLTLLGN